MKLFITILSALCFLACDIEPLPPDVIFIDCALVRNTTCNSDQDYATCGDFAIDMVDDVVYIYMYDVQPVGVVNVLGTEQFQDVGFSQVEFHDHYINFTCDSIDMKNYVIRLRVSYEDN